jgi:hypothetical protein
MGHKGESLSGTVESDMAMVVVTFYSLRVYANATEQYLV